MEKTLASFSPTWEEVNCQWPTISPALPPKHSGILPPDNPLNRLNDADRVLLFSMLMIYDVVTTRVAKDRPEEDPLERMAKLAADAAILSAKLESEVFQGPYADVFLPYISSFRDLPRRLAEFSELIGRKLNLLGKPGHKGRNLRNQYLILASEFVRLKAGQHYDEHVAELYQAIPGRPPSEDLAGDAIRKKRDYIKRCYPDLYGETLNRAMLACESTLSKNPQ